MDDLYEKLQVLKTIADECEKVKVPRTTKFTRTQVVDAFASTFQMIGGTPRLALWANDNPGDFYKLFAKLLPPQQQVVLVNTDPTNLRTISTEELEQRYLETLNVVNMDGSPAQWSDGDVVH